MKRARSLGRSSILIALFAVAVLRGCDCGGDTVGPVRAWKCEDAGRRPGPDDKACGAGQRYDKGLCQPERCDAGGQPAGCCPGMLCTQGGECLVPPSRLTLCETDGNCDRGQRCLARPLINPDAMTCGFPPLDASGECPDGGQPFNRRCFAGDTPPCGGDCSPGTVCNIDTNRCEEPPSLTNAGHGCDQECGAAQILVYADPDTMLWNQCCAVSCKCLTLPPLVPGRWGRFSAIAVATDAVYASAYDSTYGDLVLATYDRVSVAEQSLEYLDGVPSGGTVVADPNGPRGGRNGPGPDVGQHTSIALADGVPRIAYYDVEAKDLKYAAFDSASGTWATSLIDDGGDAGGTFAGDVGRYTSLLVDDRGIAHLSYYGHRTMAGAGLATGPIYARARVAAPAGPADWERIPIEVVTSCSGQCQGNERCVQDTDLPVCANPRTDCSPACACDQSCVEIGGQPACRLSLPGSLTEPCDGSCPADYACVAAATTGTICLRTRAGDCGPACGADDLCVDDGANNPICRLATPYSTLEGLAEGVGLFTSLAIFEGAPTVAYYDRLRRQLRVAGANFRYDAALSQFTAMPLACEPDNDVGEHPSLAVAPDGLSLAVAFQAHGDILRIYSGSDFLTGSIETIDDGRRDTRLNIVGGSATLTFDKASGLPYVAYHDQTDNDLLLAYRRNDAWTFTPLFEDGAYGSFACLVISAGHGYASTYLRARDTLDRDTSRLVVTTFDVATLP
ncbi:MAG: hypothetical protein HY903_09375 [Deltaproteobacteria bacterium]|nr:hypothetical protein [Deltaproteobacteria bacterium]